MESVGVRGRGGGGGFEKEDWYRRFRRIDSGRHNCSGCPGEKVARVGNLMTNLAAFAS